MCPLHNREQPWGDMHHSKGFFLAVLVEVYCDFNTVKVYCQ
jgi:hypothetical protein